MQKKRRIRSPFGAAESYLIFERPQKKSPAQKKYPPPKGRGIHPLLNFLGFSGGVYPPSPLWAGIIFLGGGLFFGSLKN